MSDADLNDVPVAQVVDARGSACPGPLLEAKKAIGSVCVGETIEIWSGDPLDQERPAQVGGQGRARVSRRPLGRRV